MSGSLLSLFSSDGFMPHGHCYLWTPSLLWLYVSSDLVIGAAYYSIPLALLYFVRKRRDLQFNWIFLLFSLFIFACGTTHLISIWTIWRPVYWLDASMKAATAGVSIATAMLLWPLIPKALRVASPEQLQSAIAQLEHEVGERKQAEAALAQLNDTLEQRVSQRTVELRASNEKLATEMESRIQAEERIRSALKEKVILLAEVHHRVKNNLQVIHSLLDLQSTQTDDLAVRAMLQNSMNRIQSMAVIHQALYESNDFARVALDNVLKTLVDNIATSYGVDGERLTITVSLAEIALPITQAIPCGLIVNELVSNALKHAFPNGASGSVSVVLDIDSAQYVTLSVSDNGIGLAQNVDLKNSPTLGLELVTLLTEQLGGGLTIRNSNPTCFTVRFALPLE